MDNKLNTLQVDRITAKRPNASQIEHSSANLARIASGREKWAIDFSCIDVRDGVIENIETCLITITQEKSFTWQGSIQDMLGMMHVLQNVSDAIVGGDAELVAEVKNCLARFTKP